MLPMGHNMFQIFGLSIANFHNSLYPGPFVGNCLLYKSESTITSFDHWESSSVLSTKANPNKASRCQQKVLNGHMAKKFKGKLTGFSHVSLQLLRPWSESMERHNETTSFRFIRYATKTQTIFPSFFHSPGHKFMPTLVITRTTHPLFKENERWDQIFIAHHPFKKLWCIITSLRYQNVTATVPTITCPLRGSFLRLSNSCGGVFVFFVLGQSWPMRLWSQRDGHDGGKYSSR